MFDTHGIGFVDGETMEQLLALFVRPLEPAKDGLWEVSNDAISLI